MSMPTAEQVVDMQLAYYNAHDIEGFVSTYSADIKLYNQGEAQPFLTGQEALRERYMKRFSIPELHADIANRMVLGNFILDFEHVRGLKENEMVKAIAIYEVRDGLIQNVWFARE